MFDGHDKLLKVELQFLVSGRPNFAEIMRKVRVFKKHEFMSSFIIYDVQRICGHDELRARICKHFKEPSNRFLAWRAGTTTLFDVPARQAT